MADDGFDRWYEEYPRKKAKEDARKAWKQTEKERPDTEELVRITRLQAEQPSWQDRRLIPYPATWLRAHRWLDEVDPPEDIEQRIGDRNWRGFLTSGGGTTVGSAMPTALRQIIADRENWGLDDEAVRAIEELVSRGDNPDWRWWYGELDKIHLLHCRRRWKQLPVETQQRLQRTATEEASGHHQERTSAEILLILIENLANIPHLAARATSRARKMG